MTLNVKHWLGLVLACVLVVTGQVAATDSNCVREEQGWVKSGKATCFLEYGKSQWGWTNGPFSCSKDSWIHFQIWFGAEDCDTSKGVLGGSGTVHVASNGKAVITYKLNSNVVELTGPVKAYFGEKPVTTVNPDDMPITVTSNPYQVRTLVPHIFYFYIYFPAKIISKDCNTPAPAVATPQPSAAETKSPTPVAVITKSPTHAPVGPPTCVTKEIGWVKTGKATCFLELGKSQWGWTNGPYQCSKNSWIHFQIWFGAEDCDTSKGVLGGSGTVHINANGKAVISYTLNSNVVRLTGPIKAYFGEKEITTINPDEMPITVTSNPYQIRTMVPHTFFFYIYFEAEIISKDCVTPQPSAAETKSPTMPVVITPQPTQATPHPSAAETNSPTPQVVITKSPTAQPSGCESELDGWVKTSKSTCFLDFGFTQWGWTNGPYKCAVGVVIPFKIWFGATGCDTSHAVLGGTGTVTINTYGKAIIHYRLNNNVIELTGPVKAYFGEKPITTINPDDLPITVIGTTYYTTDKVPLKFFFYIHFSARVKNPDCITSQPSAAETKSPTMPVIITKRPTKAPVERPSKAPSEARTKRPTKAPIERTKRPTKAPVERPSKAPSEARTKRPTKAPIERTKKPTKAPSAAETKSPTPQVVITKSPTKAPACVSHEIAWVKTSKSHCFTDYGFTEWGWTNGPWTCVVGVHIPFKIWFGATDCDTSKAVLGGTGTVTINSYGKAIIHYRLNNNVIELTEPVKAYFGSKPITTINPDEMPITVIGTTYYTTFKIPQPFFFYIYFAGTIKGGNNCTP